MSVDIIFPRLVGILHEHLGLDPSQVHLSSDLHNDLGIDSLDTMDLILVLRETFDIRIKDNEIAEIKTVEDVCQLIDSRYES